MNAKQIGLALVLVDFLVLTGVAVYEYGYIGFFQAAFSNLVAATAMADLVIALCLVMAWMVRDAKDRGVSATPFVLLTLALGSVGPLLYLIVREGQVSERHQSVVRAVA